MGFAAARAGLGSGLAQSFLLFGAPAETGPASQARSDPMSQEPGPADARSGPPRRHSGARDERARTGRRARSVQFMNTAVFCPDTSVFMDPGFCDRGDLAAPG